MVARVGILGAGTMGRGIAQVAALGGYETRLYDAFPEAAERGAEQIGFDLSKGVERGRWSDAEGEAASNRVHTAARIEELTGCDLLIEAAPEDLGLKRELFADVAAACGPEAVLASNTSSLRIAEIAAGVPNPERLIGMHFFNPPVLMKLVEVVATERSSQRALSAATTVAERMGRVPIRAKDTPGFVANRLARPFSLESLRMLDSGVADAEAIDRTVRLGGGFRMGPFELLDLIGLDVNLTIARSFFSQGGEPERWRPSPIQERLVEEGKLGRKSGQGFYEYDADGKRVVPFSPQGEQRNHAIEEEVLSRLFSQIANEAAFALADRVALPADMETAMKLGLNWPRGPLEIAADLGAERALATLERLRAERGAAYEPAPLLPELSRIKSSSG